MRFALLSYKQCNGNPVSNPFKKNLKFCCTSCFGVELRLALPVLNKTLSEDWTGIDPLAGVARLFGWHIWLKFSPCTVCRKRIACAILFLFVHISQVGCQQITPSSGKYVTAKVPRPLSTVASVALEGCRVTRASFVCNNYYFVANIALKFALRFLIAELQRWTPCLLDLSQGSLCPFALIFINFMHLQQKSHHNFSESTLLPNYCMISRHCWRSFCVDLTCETLPHIRGKSTCNHFVAVRKSPSCALWVGSNSIWDYWLTAAFRTVQLFTVQYVDFNV